MPNVEIKLTENQQKAFDVLLDDYHTAVGYGECVTNIHESDMLSYVTLLRISSRLLLFP